MTEWVAVVQEEGEEPIEIPTESDGTMLLTSVTAQFPGATGLKFRNPETGTLRGVRCHGNILFPPDPDNGWGNITFICTRPPSLMPSSSPTSTAASLSAAAAAKEAAVKRKSEYDTDRLCSKNQRVDQLDQLDHLDQDDNEDVDFDMGSVEDMGGNNATCDLIILGLPWTANEIDIRDYFETFGEIVMVQLKTKESGQSKGFAFIRFKDVDIQNKVLLTRHMIKDRWCDVKVPESQELKASKAAASCKIFVARLTETVTADDLRMHFEKFGAVTDIYIPKPFRAFAFVTFREARVAQSLFGKDHIIKGTSVHIGSAQPKAKSGGGLYTARPHAQPAYDRGYYGGAASGAYPPSWSTVPPSAGGAGAGYNRSHPRGGGYYP